MTTPSLTFRVEKTIQEKARKKAERLGIPLSLVLQQALKTFVSEKQITFTENGLTPEFEDLVLEIQNESSSQTFDNAEEALSFLRS